MGDERELGSRPCGTNERPGADSTASCSSCPNRNYKIIASCIVWIMKGTLLDSPGRVYPTATPPAVASSWPRALSPSTRSARPAEVPTGEWNIDFGREGKDFRWISVPTGGVGEVSWQLWGNAPASGEAVTSPGLHLPPHTRNNEAKVRGSEVSNVLGHELARVLSFHRIRLPLLSLSPPHHPQPAHRTPAICLQISSLLPEVSSRRILGPLSSGSLVPIPVLSHRLRWNPSRPSLHRQGVQVSPPILHPRTN